MNSELDLINYPVWYTPFTKTLYFKIILIFGIASFLAIVIFYILRKRKQKSLPESLIANLEKLKNSNLDDAVFVNSEIVNYLKIYLKETRQIDFFSMSEMEIIAYFKDVNEFKIVEPVFRLTYSLKYKSNNYETVNCKDGIERAILFINTFESQNSQI